VRCARADAAAATQRRSGPASSPMHRRNFLALSLLGPPLLMGHTPYRQWKVYRQTHLLIFTSRADPASDELGERVAARLREALPDSKARVARAPGAQRIASLITTGQADVAVLSRADALALYRSQPPFADYQPVALRVLAQTGQHQLVCREDFKHAHGWLVAEALASDPTHAMTLPGSEAVDGTVPAHAGALAFARGEPAQAQ
jgi:hypothetical protein